MWSNNRQASLFKQNMKVVRTLQNTDEVESGPWLNTTPGDVCGGGYTAPRILSLDTRLGVIRFSLWRLFSRSSVDRRLMNP